MLRKINVQENLCHITALKDLNVSYPKEQGLNSMLFNLNWH